MSNMRDFSGLKAVLAALALAVSLSNASAETISVQVNQAKIIKLTRAADTIVIGNPQIVYAPVQDATTIVLIGKGFGSTNLVVLDDAGAPIVDQQVVVSRDEASTIRIYRRAAVQTLSCQPACETALVTDAERAPTGP